MHPQTITEANSSTTSEMNRDWADRFTDRDDEDRGQLPVIATLGMSNAVFVRPDGVISIIVVPMLMMAIPTAVLPMVMVPIVIHQFRAN
jgi:hypothetical protein